MPRKKRPEPDLPPGPARDLVDLFTWLRGTRPMRVGQIANRTGYTPGHVSEVLRGWKAPSPDAAALIAQVLGADDKYGQAGAPTGRGLAGLETRQATETRSSPPAGRRTGLGP